MHAAVPGTRTCGKFLGSGFLVGPGVAVTCAHVAARAGREPVVVTAAGEQPSVTVVRMVPESPDGGRFHPYPDLAVLAVDGLPGHAVAALAASDPAPGTEVAAFGYSTVTPTLGVRWDSLMLRVAGPSDRYLRVLGDRVREGHSGSMLLDPAGLVVGILKGSSSYSESQGGWFTPVSALREVLGRPAAPPPSPAASVPHPAPSDAELVGILLAFPSLIRADGRHDLLTRMGAHLALPHAFEADERSAPREHLFRIVASCRRFDAGHDIYGGAAVNGLAAMDALVAALEDLAPYETALGRLRELVGRAAPEPPDSRPAPDSDRPDPDGVRPEPRAARERRLDESLADLITRFHELVGATTRAAAPKPGSAWPQGADELLAALLGGLGRSRSGAAPLAERLVREVREHPGGPDAGLFTLRTAARTALRGAGPAVGTLAWLELTVLGLTGDAPLPAAICVELVAALHMLSDPPTPAEIARHIPDVAGAALRTGRETLPEIMLWLSDLRGASGPGPLIGFLTALAADRPPAAYDRFSALRQLLGRIPVAPDPEPTVPSQGRLIIQIRVEALDPEHVPDGRYELRGAYYVQPQNGDPLVPLNRSLTASKPFRRSELMRPGSKRLPDWAELAREVGRARGGVRVEFLLPLDLLGHDAELWSAGSTGTALGLHHPVVVRSLERYTDTWVHGPWQRRWRHLRRDTSYPKVLDRIEWPPLGAEPREPAAAGPAAGLAAWLGEHQESACLGLSMPYDRLAAGTRAAVRDALFNEGVPVMVWRRDPGDHRELVSALSDMEPLRLSDLPEAVHRCRRERRNAGDQDVGHHITLFWDDADCVDFDQDRRFSGMA
ncbi:trypsin-like peptidase domain-containing protein [Streptomyces polygonati]|uniref:Trypsin-like peptidase domain-containing protein n=1 Tax=Streptomyces polygonati TaxID=1617087 RepID=A0ABV8HHI5_9ACTN